VCWLSGIAAAAYWVHQRRMAASELLSAGSVL